MNQMRRIASPVPYVLLLILTLLIISCGKKKEANQARNSSGPSLMVEAVIIKPVRLDDEVFATANLLSYEEVELKAPVTGTVLSINFQEGQYVTKGQSLIHIDDRSWKAQIKGARAQLVNAKNELERKTELIKVGGASQQDVDNARATVDALEAQIEQLSVSVDLANVVAPFDGKVGMRNFSLGSFLSQGQTITVLVQSRKLKVDFNISSRYLDKIRVGHEVWVISSSDTVKAAVYAINPTVSTSSRTIQIRAIIDNNSKNFVPGDFAEVIIPVNIDENALVVPSNCIVPELNSQTVYFYKNKRAVRKEVVLGVQNEKIVQILEGISPGDTIITTGLVQIKDQMMVQISKIIDLQAL